MTIRQLLCHRFPLLFALLTPFLCFGLTPKTKPTGHAASNQRNQSQSEAQNGKATEGGVRGAPKQPAKHKELEPYPTPEEKWIHLYPGDSLKIEGMPIPINCEDKPK